VGEVVVGEAVGVLVGASVVLVGAVCVQSTQHYS
jgi:hypothetical protein